MTTKSKNRASKGTPPSANKEVVRLRSEVARLRAELRALKGRASHPRKSRAPAGGSGPPLPPPDADGNYPATETLRAILARQIVRRRRAARWTQAELAARAGVRQETVSRIEGGKNAPNVTTVDKLDRALKAAGV
jgi:DNA-binding XRE family transcriptional regulator